MFSAAGGVNVHQGGERAADDLLCSLNYPLKPLSAMVQLPYHVVMQYVSRLSMNGAVEGQQEVGVQVVLPEDPQEVQPLLSLLDDRSRRCQRRRGRRETGRFGPSPHIRVNVQGA